MASLWELKVRGNAIGALASLKELARGAGRARASELELCVISISLCSKTIRHETTYHKLARDVTDLPAFGIASASIGSGRAFLGGGSSDGSEGGHESDGELHFGDGGCLEVEMGPK